MKTETDWLNIKAWIFSGLVSALLSLSFTIILMKLSNNDSFWVGVLVFDFILVFLITQIQPRIKESLELIHNR